VKFDTGDIYVKSADFPNLVKIGQISGTTGGRVFHFVGSDIYNNNTKEVLLCSRVNAFRICYIVDSDLRT
jgi:hypothetical protein